MVEPNKTPLPDTDNGAVEMFWDRFLTATGRHVERYVDVSPFGDSAELVEELLELALIGQKRATAGSVAEFAARGAPLPAEGDHWILTDGRGRPRAVVETVQVRTGPLSSVDESFAWDEGEGDRTRDDWLSQHTTYYKRTHAAQDIPFDPEMPVAFERFELVYVEDENGKRIAPPTLRPI